MREHFRRIADVLDEDERELIAASAALTPGERIARALQLSGELLDDYRRLLADPSFAADEDLRVARKADLHMAWRNRPRSPG